MRQAALLCVFFVCTTSVFWMLGYCETLAEEPKTTTSETPSTEDSDEALHLYTALDTNEAKIYIRAFEAETGIEVRWVRLSAGEVLVRIKSERANPQVALWFGGPSPEFIVAKREGLLAPYAPRINFEPLRRHIRRSTLLDRLLLRCNRLCFQHRNFSTQRDSTTNLVVRPIKIPNSKVKSVWLMPIHRVLPTHCWLRLCR